MTAPANAIDGPRIRRLRRERGDDLEPLAARAGISAVYLSKIERGERVPSEEVRRRLCDVLGVTDLTPPADDSADDRLLIPLQEVARQTGFRYDTLAIECRNGQWEHVERNGYRAMTREQIEALIAAHTKQVGAPQLTDEEQRVANHKALIEQRLTNQTRRSRGRKAA